MTPRESMYEKLGTIVVAALEQRHFAAQYCATSEDAKAAVLALIEKDKVVSWGGSMTVTGLGIQAALKERGQPVLDRDTVQTPAEKKAIMKQAMTSDVYLMSANAISVDGCLVNMDGNGNRLAALLYGPDQVIVVAGMNKVVSTVEDAVQRVRNLAAPMNAQRFPGVSPCRVTGSCADCLSLDSICAQLVITRLCKPAGRIHVILVGEDLGM